MSLISLLPLYILIGFIEWFLALRRTLACARNEKVMLVCIVFIENLVSLWVLSNFIEKKDWMIAICYAIGGAMGSLMITFMNKDKPQLSENGVPNGPSIVGLCNSGSTAATFFAKSAW